MSRAELKQRISDCFHDAEAWNSRTLKNQGFKNISELLFREVLSEVADLQPDPWGAGAAVEMWTRKRRWRIFFIFEFVGSMLQPARN
jgi:hypothetical protein